MFAFAGLWETWRDKAAGHKLRTYTILTTDPNELMEPIHNRMPVILHRQEYERWLASTDPAHLPIDLLKPYFGRSDESLESRQSGWEYPEQ